MRYHLYALLCVLFIATGQILFKLAALKMNDGGGQSLKLGLFILLSALFVYGLTTIGWVYVLKNLELSKAYPIMALSFVLVPLGCHFVLNETLSFAYCVGVLLIVVGVIVTVWV